MGITDEQFAQIYHRHVHMVYRVCFMLLKNTADAEERFGKQRLYQNRGRLYQYV